ncbi:MAG: uncharacterized membrane protein YhaH (DUF805 family) [Flavobacteriales bacterium]|jgi:uncharacterized membrane protein YhaH (DUF805 family)
MMIDYYKKVVFENYANFNGRARRSEFWYFYLMNMIISIGLGIVDGAAGLQLSAGSTGVLGGFYSLAVLVPTIAVSARRMHDVGKSGWYMLIPIYNIILFATEGDKGSNDYGKDPKNPEMDLEDHLVD